jgi:2-oxoglutarate dehydrogenase E1 component
VVSSIEQFCEGTHFQEVMDDQAGDKTRVERIILCSGKVYYDLMEQRPKESRSVVILRLEQIYPFPAEQLQRILNKYPRGHADIVWVQEESHNMGAWFFVEPRLRVLGYDVKFIGRDASASPATGALEIHKREQRELVRAAFQGKGPHLVCSYHPADLFASSSQASSEKSYPANGAGDDHQKASEEKGKASEDGNERAKK